MLRPWYFTLELDKEDRQFPLYKQIAQKIQSLIVSGGLKPGEALPGSRVLAAKLGVSRKSVVNAMELLVLAGWLVNKERSGLYVAPPPVRNSLPGVVASRQDEERKPAYELRVDDGVPDTSLAPMGELARAYRRLLRIKGKHNVLGYQVPDGVRKFREAISAMLNHERGMCTQVDEIFITRGSQMALYLVAHALLKRGDGILVEQPCYEKARDAFLQAGLEVIPVDVDRHGIVTADIPSRLASHVRAIYLTPRHQYPTMAELSAERRRRLAELVVEHELLLIEDDYDCDFSFRDNPVMPLCTLLPAERYAYIGTFSKIIAPAIRVGFMAMAAKHVADIGRLRALVDIQGDVVMEAAVLELIESGVVRRHIGKSAKHYRQKRAQFVELLRRYAAGCVDFDVPHGGLALWVRPLPSTDEDSLRRALEKHRLHIPVFSNSRGETGMRIGYASLSKDDMERVAKGVGKAVASLGGG